MTTHEASADVAASPQGVYDYLADVENLPEYLPRMTEAHRSGEQEVEVEATLDLPGEQGERDVHGHAQLVTDAEARTITWTSENENQYGGEIRVSGDGGDACTVTIRLQWQHGDPEHVDADLERSVERVKDLVEQRGRAS